VLVVLDGGLVAARPGLADEVRRWAQDHAARVELAGDPVVVAGGEACKNDPAHLATLLARMDETKLDRQSFVAIAGGGAVLDMAGYAAAISHRGIRVVRLPSTVLSQADSGVGVKNGVNAFGKKNFLGTFAPPFAVVIDTGLLDTLPARDRTAGMAEAVKVGLVREAALFEWMAERAHRLAEGERGLVDELVQRSAQVHLRHIATSGDPFEMGSARPLDYGHWAAHKLESMTEHRLRHGEAVAIGMALDALYSADVGLASSAAAQRVVDLLRVLGLPLWDEALARTSAGGRLVVLDGLSEFREHLGGELTITLLADIGRGVDVHDVDEARMARVIGRLREAAA
jgi:3-dehydroquinate synthase